jgi:hypothetical protein
MSKKIGMRFQAIVWFDEDGKLILRECDASWAITPLKEIATPEMRKQLREFILEDVFREGVVADDDGETTTTVCPSTGKITRTPRQTEP